MGSETQLAIRLRADGIGQVTSGLDAVAQSARQAAVDSENASLAIAGIGQSAGVASEQIVPASNHAAESIARIGGAAEVSAAQMRMARTIVVQNLINMGTAAVVTHGNIIATLSPLPDLLYGINQMGSGAAASARNMMLFGGAFVAVAGGMAAVIAHAVTLESRTRQMNVSIKAMGDAAGITGEQLRKLSEAAATKGPFSRAETAEAANALASSHPLIAGNMIGKLLNTSVDFSAAFGKDLISGTNTLAGALEKGYAGIRQLDEQLNFLTRDELKQIETMTLMGKQTDAMGVALDALNRRFGGLAKEGMSESAKAWHSMTDEVSRFLDKVSNSDFVVSFMQRFTDGLKRMRGESDPADIPIRHGLALGELTKGREQLAEAQQRLATLPEGTWEYKRALADARTAQGWINKYQNEIASLKQPAPVQSQSVSASFAADADAQKTKDQTERDAKKIEELQKQLSGEARVLSVSAPNRPLMQARVDAENYAKTNNVGVAEVQNLMTDAAFKRIAAAARDATDELRYNADAQGRVADAAAISDIAMRKAAVDNDIARFAVEKHGIQLEEYTEQARRMFDNENRARRNQWAREIDDQASAANRLSDAYKAHSVAAIDVAERENQIQDAVRRLGVTAEEAATQIDKLFAHKWDQVAVQLNRSGDPNLNYRMQSEELERARATGILSERAYAEHAKRNYHEMLEASKAWSDGARLAVLDYTDEINNSAKQANTFFSGAFKKGEDSLVKMITGGTKGFKNLKESFLDFANGMVEGLVRIGVQQEFMRPLAQTLFGGSGGGSGGGFGGGGLLAGLGGLLGFGGGGGSLDGMLNADGSIDSWVFHGGGIAGEGSRAVKAPATLFARAPRFHGGGLASDEVPAILQRDEGVFTSSQMRRLAPVGAGGAGGNGATVNVTFNVQALDARGVSDAIYQQRDLIVGIVNQATARRGGKGVRT
ncbi:hypothetical protein SIID45300_02388 [Candidatus Magnetaquicoccaceae bacterium FCR-1]|uniref:Bacteriophage tail tape measure C-terminal domain-containing protein n=1 Tax=Candidatus Magnetaquiglobus chichijimensis TaxID=3141448 RepID=A0ABQ0CAZ8_9PROT